MNKLKEKVSAIRGLPIEKFKKRFNEMYNSANDEEKKEIIRLFEEGTDELISRLDAFIEETTRMIEHDKMRELQFA